MLKKAGLIAALASGTLLGACTNASESLAGSSSASSAPSGSPRTTASASVDAAAAALVPADIKSAGKLRVATDATYPPFESMDTDNKTIVGADIDLIKDIGARLGVQVDLQNTNFDAIVPGFAAGKFDVAVSGIADKAARRDHISFVDYAKNSAAFMVKTADKSKYPTWASVCGTKIAVQSGTTMADDVVAADKKCTSEGKPGIEISNYRTQNDVTLALQSGRAAVGVSTGGSIAAIIKETGQAFVLTTPPDQFTEAGLLGIAVRKDEPDLVKAIQAALKATIADGTYDRIFTQWGLMDCCSDHSAQINGGKI